MSVHSPLCINIPATANGQTYRSAWLPKPKLPAYGFLATWGAGLQATCSVEVSSDPGCYTDPTSNTVRKTPLDIAFTNAAGQSVQPGGAGDTGGLQVDIETQALFIRFVAAVTGGSPKLLQVDGHAVGV